MSPLSRPSSLVMALAAALAVAGCASGLRSDRWEVRARSVERALTDDAFIDGAELRDLLRDPSSAVRAAAIDYARTRRVHDAVPALQDLVRMDDDMRPAALLALADIVGLDAEMTREAVREIRSPSVEGRLLAAEAVRTARAYDALPALLDAARSPGVNVGLEAVREAASALAGIPVSQGPDPYDAFVRNGLPALVAQDLFHAEVARALILGDETPQDLKFAVVHGYAISSATTTSVDVLTAAFGHRDRRIQAEAARGLARMGEPGYRALAPELARRTESSDAARVAEVVAAEIVSSGDPDHPFLRLAREDGRAGLAEFATWVSARLAP